MGLGSTAKKLQNLVDIAEDLYNRVNDLRDRLIRMETTIDETSSRVESVEADIVELRAIVEAIAADQDVDVEAVVDAIDHEAATVDSTVDQAEQDGNS